MPGPGPGADHRWRSGKNARGWLYSQRVLDFACSRWSTSLITEQTIKWNQQNKNDFQYRM